MKILLCISFSSCSNRPITKSEIDDYISKNNNVSFSGLKNIFIAQRSASPFQIIYVINRFEGDHPVYFATLNVITNAVTDIHTLQSGAIGPGDYVSKEEIANALKIINRNKLYLLAVDSLNNIYVNPFFVNQPPYLMRLSNPKGDSIIRRGYLYQLYKGNWYLNSHRRIQ